MIVLGAILLILGLMFACQHPDVHRRGPARHRRGVLDPGCGRPARSAAGESGTSAPLVPLVGRGQRSDRHRPQDGTRVGLGRFRRTRLHAECGVEFSSPNVACAISRASASSRRRFSCAQHVHPDLDVLSLRPADLTLGARRAGGPGRGPGCGSGRTRRARSRGGSRSARPAPQCGVVGAARRRRWRRPAAGC